VTGTVALVTIVPGRGLSNVRLPIVMAAWVTGGAGATAAMASAPALTRARVNRFIRASS